MKLLLSFLCWCIFAGAAAQPVPGKLDRPDLTRKVDTLEVACGMCQFDLQGKDCALAIRIDAKAYYVDGTGIDEHGDAHARDGFCNKIRKAAMQGILENGRYKVSYFKLFPTAVPASSQ
jgi:hypothetical protein